MVIVKNLQVDDFNLVSEIYNKDNIDFKKCIDLVSTLDDDYKKLLPKKSKIKVTFELHDTNTDLANGIRRCLMDELDILSFDFNEHEDLTSDDPFILCDFIKKQIELLPINQEYAYEGIKIELKKRNITDEIIDVTSDDFVISGDKKHKQSDLEKIVGGNIVLCRLRPMCHINIMNIKIINGTALENAGKFSAIAGIDYRPLDVDPIVETKTGITGVSSMRSNPTKFRISYTTHRNVSNPLKLIVNVCDNLIERLDLILEDFGNIKNDAINYFSPLLTLESSNDLKKIQIKGEYWTIINLITRYCYLVSKTNIKFVSPALIHPEKNIGVINIIHPEFSTLIQNAIKKIITELATVASKF
jgi:DNA-directed RNA polymerase subunit L